jgi:hypothetical protein
LKLRSLEPDISNSKITSVQDQNHCISQFG